MSETRIGCPVSRYGGQRPCQNHGASARTATRTKTPGAPHKVPASLPGEQALRTCTSCARVRAVKPRRCNSLVVSLPGRLPKTGL